jgi:hypothetical protein
MRERVASLDGSLEIGPRATGGFRVRVRLPLARRSTTADDRADRDVEDADPAEYVEHVEHEHAEHAEYADRVEPSRTPEPADSTR